MITFIIILILLLKHLFRNKIKNKKEQKEINTKPEVEKEKNQLWTLVIMQLKNKIDMSWVKSTKSLIRTIVLNLLKFLVVAVIAFVILFLLEFIGVFYSSEGNKIMILVVSFSLLLSLISCTFGLMNNLYFSDDNKVLITFPVSANKIFISKMIVYYFYELKRSLQFLLPITLGCIVLLLYRNSISPMVLIWMWFPLVLIVAIPVILGAILSIPLMYIKIFLNKHQIIEAITYLILLIGSVALIVWLISLIPENIDLINQWPTIREVIKNFLIQVEARLKIMSQMIYMIIGSKQANMKFAITFMTIARFFITIDVIGTLFVIVYFASRPLFFKMMAKSFEVDTGHVKSAKNAIRGRYATFINKEFKISLRTFDVSVNYLIIYVAIPIAILLLNSIYAAMETKSLGAIMTYTANVLLICLPLLASNSLIATLYSREGRAGYVKKTKPIFARYPLLAKLFFNVIFSIPVVFITVTIFGCFSNFKAIDIILLGFAIGLIHLGDMLWCAMLDIMNPQNEQYATTGEVVSNPNEDKATIIAFILSFVIALISYKLFSESTLATGGVTIACVKLFLIGACFFIALLVLFSLKVKAYYYDK